MIPPHTKEKQLLPVDSDEVLANKKKNASKTAAMNHNDSSVWW